jgi:uncharacterized protein YegL
MSEQLLPFYLVCDESGSMGDSIDQMNSQLLPELHREIASNPVVADKTRFSIIGFAETARVLLPLSDLSDLHGLPGLVARGTTCYGGAFELLRQTIDADVTGLKAEGNLVYRPAVFFLSDGLPTDDDWEVAYDKHMEASWPFAPKIISFGIGDSDAPTIKRVANFQAFIVEGGMNPATALNEFAAAFTKSIVMSSNGNGSGLTLQVPDKIDGFTALPLDTL